MLFVVATIAKSLYVDWLWFDSVDSAGAVSYSSVFQRIVVVKILLFVGGAVLAAVVIGANIWLARRFAPKGVEESFIEEVDPAAIRRIVTIALVAATLFLAVVFGAVAGGAWRTILSWMNAVPFGVADPAFDKDISFYLFDLPAFHLMQRWVLWLVIVSGAAAGAVYGLTFSLQRFELSITRGMRIHLSLLVGLVLVLIAGGTYLGIFDLATAPGGVVAGATYTDINARLPVRYALIALAGFAGLVTIVNAVVSSGYRVPIFAVGLWAIAGIVAGAIYPALIQRTQVDPNELEKERQFIKRNIDFTRLAYGLDSIVEDSFPAEKSVTDAEIAANQATISNIRLLDERPLRDTFNQLQSLRPFYFFTDVDVDRYEIDGQIRQVMISARELDVGRAQANWTNERLKLTHGYGAVIAPVNKVTPEGQPELLTRDIPPEGDQIPISEDGARIYFGELTNQYVIVKTSEREFDYPVGEIFAETTYEPDRGIRLGNVFRRFVLAWELGDANLLISGRISSGSRLLMNRSLRERITEIAPFLTLDPDPYLVVDDGRLIWIQDAYTTSERFPYSQPTGSINYIRNSVKITVDAITGDTTFYRIDERDPVAGTWAKIFPDLFTDADDMPTVIQEHLRYPERLFRFQAERYLKYHITDPDVFFLGEDIWNIPTEKFRQQEQPVDPYYVIMTLPGEQQEEFALILPFTPGNKQNTIAWFAGREPAAGEYTGTLRAYRFPTDDLVLGPAQIEALIDQHTGISQQLTLWDQAGSEVIRGNLLMIPVGDSFLYVEPIYLQAETSRLPELKRVVVVNGNAIAMEPTFEDALDVVFGRLASTLPGAALLAPSAAPPVAPVAPARPATPPPVGSLDELLGQADDAADAAQQELETLRGIIEAIRQRQDQ